MIIDIHNHFGLSGDGGFGQIEEILENLKTVGISKAVVFPIDDHAQKQSYPEMNDAVLAAQQAYPDKIIAFCRVAAADTETAINELNRCVDSGHRGVKLHPRSDNFEPAQARPIFEEARRLRIPVVVHTGHQAHGHPLEWVPLLSRFPEVSTVLAHGGKDAYRELAQAYKELRHVFIETSCLSLFRSRFLLNSLGAERMIFGSDYPYSHPAIELAKWTLLLPETKQQRKVFYDNALCFLGG